MLKTISKIFLDSSVVIAALGSKSGGSSLIVSYQGGRYRCLISKAVLSEVFSKKEKLGLSKKEIENWIKRHGIIVSRAPTDEEKEQFLKVTKDLKDRHVLAAARNNQVDILLSYDRKHIIVEEVIAYMEPIKVMTPRQFLQEKPVIKESG